MRYQDWCRYIGNDQTLDHQGAKIERARCVCGWASDWYFSYRQAFLAFAGHSRDFYDPMYEETIERLPLYQLSHNPRQ